MHELVQARVCAHPCARIGVCVRAQNMYVCVSVNLGAIDCGQEHFKKVNTEHCSAISSRSYFPHKRRL